MFVVSNVSTVRDELWLGCLQAAASADLMYSVWCVVCHVVDVSQALEQRCRLQHNVNLFTPFILFLLCTSLFTFGSYCATQCSLISSYLLLSEAPVDQILCFLRLQLT